MGRRPVRGAFGGGRQSGGSVAPSDNAGACGSSLQNVATKWEGNDVLALGLSLVGFNEDRQKNPRENVRRFRAHFGVGHESFGQLIQ